MRRLAASLALLLPALSFAAGPVRVVPSVAGPLCASCGLAGTQGSSLGSPSLSISGPSLSLSAPTLSATLAPSLSAPGALTVSAPIAALSAPAGGAAPQLILPGRASAGAPKKLIVAAGGDVEEALAAARREDEAASRAGQDGAAENERLMALFDGSRPAGDAPFGAAVSAARGEGDVRAIERSLAASVADIRRETDAAVPALRRSVELGQWNGPHTTLDGPCCGDAAPKLAAYLRLRGYPAVLVEAEFHFYVVVKLPEGDVVVDPTFRQFFGRGEAPASVPQVFVGTWPALDAEFAAHQRAKSTRLWPQRIYRSEARVREDLLREAARSLASSSVEHAGLRAAALSPREGPSGPQPLIIP
jgi:hypothetical protein